MNKKVLYGLVVFATIFVASVTSLAAWQLAKKQNVPTKTVPLAASPVKNLPDRFLPGLNQLGELYKTKSPLILSSSVRVLFGGSVRAITPGSITIRSGETEYAIANQTTQHPIVYVSASRNGEKPKKLELGDIRAGDEVNIAALLDLSEGTWTIEYVAKTTP